MHCNQRRITCVEYCMLLYHYGLSKIILRDNPWSSRTQPVLISGFLAQFATSLFRSTVTGMLHMYASGLVTFCVLSVPHRMSLFLRTTHKQLHAEHARYRSLKFTPLVSKIRLCQSTPIQLEKRHKAYKTQRVSARETVSKNIIRQQTG